MNGFSLGVCRRGAACIGVFCAVVVISAALCGCESDDGSDGGAAAQSTANGSAPAVSSQPPSGGTSFEAEDFGGSLKQRGNASAQATALLFAGQAITMPLSWPATSPASVNVTYSNDGGADDLTILIDGEKVGSMTTRSTGSGGFGWNSFASADVSIGMLTAGSHTLTVTVDSSDSYGVELDRLDAVGGQ